MANGRISEMRQLQVDFEAENQPIMTLEWDVTRKNRELRLHINNQTGRSWTLSDENGTLEDDKVFKESVWIDTSKNGLQTVLVAHEVTSSSETTPVSETTSTAEAAAASENTSGAEGTPASPEGQSEQQ